MAAATTGSLSTPMLGRLRTLGLGPIGVEKLAIVIEIGSEFTKCGFAGESAPRHIVRSEIKRNGNMHRVHDPESVLEENELKEILIDFFFEIFYKYLLVKTSERRVLVCENPWTPTVFRQALASVLLTHYKVSIFMCQCAALLFVIFCFHFVFVSFLHECKSPRSCRCVLHRHIHSRCFRLALERGLSLIADIQRPVLSRSQTIPR
jgi:actin-related protein